MQAMVYHDYGSPDNLDLQEVEMPAVVDGGVLVVVHAASVKWHDWHFRPDNGIGVLPILAISWS